MPQRTVATQDWNWVLVDWRICAILESPLRDFRVKVRGRDAQLDGALLTMHQAAMEWQKARAALGTINAEPPEPRGESKLLGTAASSARLGVTERQVRKLLAAGHLDGTKEEGRWRITPASVDAYVIARARRR